MNRICFTVVLVLFLFATPLHAGVGESAIITLAFPFGARAYGMGEVGTALADGPSVLYWNPAGLGVKNRSWRNGSGFYSYEQLLPAFGLSELWHCATAACYQLPNSMGGFGTYLNYINMGRNPIIDALGNERKSVRSWEAVMALGWGFSLEEFGAPDQYLGITFKPFISALAPGLGPGGEGVAQSFAIDLGYLHIFRNGLRIGMTLVNMGPAVYYVEHEFRDPIPFTANFALGYKKKVVVEGVDIVRVAAEIRLDKELVVNHYDGAPEPFFKAMHTDLFNESLEYELQEINYHLGAEIRILNTVCYRQGFLFDYIGERYEMHYGIGCNLFNHIKADFSWIYAPEGYFKEQLQRHDKNKEGATGARHLQWNLSFTLDGIAGWRDEDLQWWKVND